MKKIKICYFGSFIPDYSRNHILIKGLVENKCELIFCNDQSTGFQHGLKLIKNFLLNGRKCKVIFVGVFGHHDMFLAWVLAKLFRKKLVFDAFISFYDTYVNDRSLLSKYSPSALLIFFLDFLATHLADLVLLDTKAHAKYFISTFKLKPLKVKTLYIGADQDFFKPIAKKFSKRFTVEFHGSYQPLQGVDYIIKAISLLKKQKDIQFILIGDGQTKKEVLKLASKLKVKNIQFLPRQELSKVREILNRSDIALGIFGKSEKAARVIPNKTYESIALKKTVITMDGVAIREVFQNNKNIFLVSNQNPQQLANIILKLKNNKKLNKKVALAGFNLYLNNFTTSILGAQLKKIMLNLN